MSLPDLADLLPVTERHPVAYPVARVSALSPTHATLAPVPDGFGVGDRIVFPGCDQVRGQLVARTRDEATVVFEGSATTVAIGAPAISHGPDRIAPTDAWLGRVIDSTGCPRDGAPLLQGPRERPLMADPPTDRRHGFGPRFSTGLAVFDTILPVVEGQRIGIFAGAGVGKSTLIGTFASHLDADIVVIALVGERGREVGAFIDHILGPRGLARSVVVVETSDRPALARRRVVNTAITVAEHFRDQGQRVLLMVDSITRLAEAHREIALLSGEVPAFRGHPPSLVPYLAGLVERTGTGGAGQGSITTLLSVLVAGNDVDEPVSDTMRGLLDGHFVLSRAIAEAGRFPAVDVLKSVSRALPDCATDGENSMIATVRRDLSLCDASRIMRQSGLYQAGNDNELDLALARQPALEAFLASPSRGDVTESFAALSDILTDPQPNEG